MSSAEALVPSLVWTAADGNGTPAGPDGPPLDPESVAQVFDRRVALGSRGSPFHDLRHRHVAQRMRRGRPPRARHTGVEMCYGWPLGLDHAVLMLTRRRIREAEGEGLPPAVPARDTSAPDAKREACRVTRLVAECTGAPRS